MLNQLLSKIKTALKNENCSQCQVMAVEKGLICGQCRQKFGLREGFPLSKTGPFTIHSAAMFNPQLKRLLYPYKFYHRSDYAPKLSDILIDYWQRANTIDSLNASEAKASLVVPIPSRWKENHVSAFAQRFAEHFAYDFKDNLLHWERDTIPQHKITGKRRRWENVSGSMGVFLKDSKKDLNQESLQADGQRPRIGASISEFQTILIIDDMTTTGATFYEASQAFERASGFNGKIINLSLCHVPLALRKQVL